MSFRLDPQRTSFHALALRIIFSAFLWASVACQAQVFSTETADCKYSYEFEGSRLDFCSVKVRQELLHPDAKRHHVEVYGYLINRSSHLWARVRFEITLKGLDGETGKQVKHSWTVVRNRIHKEVPETFAEWFPSGVTRPGFFENPVVSVRVIDEYTFPKMEQLQSAINEEELAQRQAQARDAAKAKRQADDNEALRRRRRAELALACRHVYQSTSSKRIADLTVKEADQISACKALGMYR
jgi:hypothetical protein